MITAAVAALLVLPLIVLRRRTLWTYFATDAVTWLFAWIVWRRVAGDVDPYVAFVALAVVKLATFSLFLACGRDVRWSANRAALLAAIVYVVAVPAMLRTPIDGDEPFYLLVTESIIGDFDLDLANQYKTLGRSATGRPDLVPQLGDPTGAGGEQYSRHEPFLPLLMVPGYLIARLHGAIAVIVLFGILLVRSTVRWMEDEGISEGAMRAVFPFFAFGPPLLFYATRIWPEVPAAFCYVEALRGVRERRVQRWLPAIFGLVMLKLRFVLVAIGLLAVLFRGAARRSTILLILAIVAIPMLIAYLVTGSPTNVHSWREIVPGMPFDYARGFFGLLADGMSGIAFRAPFYLLGLFALVRWRSMPRGFRDGILAALLYVLYLLPRMEWYGGWAPPLRYIVFLMPVLALGAAAAWDHLSRGAIALIAAWTAGLAIHGLAYPWRLFHIANGENAVGEWLSRMHATDVSRLFPSFVRMNGAAWIGAAAVVLIVIFGVRRYKIDLAIPIFALALALGFNEARRPAAARVEFEDAHVRHEGGDLYPEFFQVVRVAYRGGWVMEAGDSMSFLAREGPWTLHYISGPGAMLEIAGRAYQLPPTDRYAAARVVIPRGGRVSMRCLTGSVNIDRMDRD